MKNKKLLPVAALIAVLAVGAYALFLSPGAREKVLQAELDKVEIAIGEYNGEVDRYPPAQIAKLDEVYTSLASLHSDEPAYMLELVKTACYKQDFQLAEERVQAMRERWPDASETEEAPGYITMFKDYWSGAEKRKADREARRKAREERQRQREQNGEGEGQNAGQGQGGERRGGSEAGANNAATDGAPAGDQSAASPAGAGRPGASGEGAPGGRRRPGMGGAGSAPAQGGAAGG